jgi:hypothetical protein
MSASCDSCKSLDFSFYQTSYGKVPPQVDLGVLDNLSQRGDCPICGLVLGFLGSDHVLAKVPKSSQGHILLKPWEMGIEIYYGSEETGGTIKKPDICLLGELSVFPKINSSLYDDEPGGRKVSASLLKRFLHSCETRHGTLCSDARGPVSDRRSVTLLLLDVEKQCIVSFDSSLECRYVALSYVWGGVKTLQTTRENLFTLMQQNSLIKFGDQLPNVIRDAMLVVAMIGERFLWIDSLCIVQDDPNWKHLQISQMDLIYSHSILTIVAVFGTNANHGLPGINQTLRVPTAAYVQDAVIARPTSYMVNSLTNTVYETRAWTLQEKALSKRCLFFSPEQVFFRCNAGIHQENVEEPLIKLTASASVARANSVNPLSRFTSTSNGTRDKRALLWSNTFHHYTFLLNDYTGRQLSFPSDILLAFEGLGAMFSSISGGKFLCGLPESVFDHSLLWMHARGINFTRRSSAIDIGHSKNLRAPSWSWCGWVGRVENILSTKNSLEMLRNFIQVFEVYSPDGIIPVRRLTSIGEVEMHEGGAGSTPRSWESRLLRGNACEMMPFRTHLLVFSTPSLESNLFNLEPIPKKYATIPWESWLLDQRGRRCGVLWETIPELTQAQQQNFGFVALSYSKWENCSGNRHEMGGGWDIFNIDAKAYSVSPGSIPVSAAVAARSVSSDIFEGVNVLFVEWKRNENGCEWAERVSLGIIHEDAWIASKPQERMVKLA